MQYISTLRFNPAIILLFLVFFTLSVQSENVNENQPWETVTSADGSFPTPRHEAAAVVISDDLYLLGGRGIRPVDRYDNESNTWLALGATVEEVHHFQPVVWNGLIYLLGGFYCCYPNEPSFTHIQIYNPANDVWSVGSEIPEARRRGGAAAVLYQNKMYMLGGNNLGHNGGAVAWFDEYDPVSGQWRTLPDAPSARDHFYAALIGDKLIAAGGRESTQPNPFENAVTSVDIYDFGTGKWTTASDPIPTPRAGAMVATYGSEVLVIGGEISEHTTALDVVEAYDVNTGKWRLLQSLGLARHSGGAGIIGDYLHVAAGGKNKGGGAETSSHERLLLKTIVAPPVDTDVDGLNDVDELSIYDTDPEDADSDDDALDDGREVTLGTDPNDADSDNDELSDGDEVSRYLTDPLLVDTDSDGLSDGAEVVLHLSNPLDVDSDADGLDDGEEIELGLDPGSSDSDQDELSDYLEVSVAGSNPLVSDTDEEGLSDGEEFIIYKTDPTLADTDGDGLSDLEELDAGLNPLVADTDDDGVEDFEELETLNSPPETSSDGAGSLSAVLILLLLVILTCLNRVRMRPLKLH